MNTRCLFLLGWLALSTAVFSQTLAPQTPAPLYEHLLEINAEWRHYIAPESWKSETISFETDRDRIHLHLELVHEILTDQSTDHLSEGQVANRKLALANLFHYYESRRFPINTHHDTRIPYFIDDYGTACAVGHLLIESGEAAFAQRIQQEMNYAYIAEMPYAELGKWAETQGFTGEELAWIQPGYPPAEPFSRMGNGANGPVSAFAPDTANDRMFIGGAFSKVNGTECVNVVSWNGTQFEALGNGLPGTIHALEYFDGMLYAGGSFMGGNNNLAVWDGNSWILSNVLLGEVMTLHVHAGALYAGGSLAISGTASLIYVNLAKLENGNWTAQGTGSFDGPIRTLATYQGDLVAGGEFQAYNQDSLGYTARYASDAWTSLGDGLDNDVYTLYVQIDTLYAGGRFFNDLQSPTFGLARIDTGDWKQLIDPTQYIKPSNPTYSEYVSVLYPLTVGNSTELYVGGHFGIYPLVGVFGDNIATLEGGGGDAYLGAVAQLDAPVMSLASLNTDLYLGGQFTGHLSKTGAPVEPVGIGEGLRIPHLSMQPNPASDQAFIELGDIPLKPDMQLRVFSAAGYQTEVPYSMYQTGIEVQLEQLPQGMYYFEVVDPIRKMGVGKFVVQ